MPSVWNWGKERQWSVPAINQYRWDREFFGCGTVLKMFPHIQAMLGWPCSSYRNIICLEQPLQSTISRIAMQPLCILHTKSSASNSDTPHLHSVLSWSHSITACSHHCPPPPCVAYIHHTMCGTLSNIRDITSFFFCFRETTAMINWIWNQFS